MLLCSDKDNIIDKILKSYEVYYDVEKCENKSLPLVATCEFHVHNEKYVLSKKAQLWSSDANEYIYIFKTDTLTKNMFVQCRDYAYDEGMRVINPKPGHMYSYISTIFVYDTCDKETENLIKKCKISKNFKFSFHGWMDFHIACINTTENKIYSNKSGKVTSDFLEELFYKKNSRFKKLKKQYN